MKSLLFVCLLALLVLTSGCASQRLFQPDATRPPVALDSLPAAAQHRLAADDKVSISIWDHSDLSVGSIYGIYNSNQVYGKWLMLDASGHVNLPKLGPTSLLGLTAPEAEAQLREAYGKLIVNPVVEVRILNRSITVLGEVNQPGRFTLEQERNHLVDLIGEAGGFKDDADRRSIQIIRRDSAGAATAFLDLTAFDPINADANWLQSGDIIYVPSRRGKLFDRRITTIIPFASAITAIAIVYSATRPE